MKKTLPPIFIRPTVSIHEAMRVIDRGGLGIALVVSNKGAFAGLVTDGDIRKAILNGVDTSGTVREIMNANPAVIRGEVTLQALETIKTRKDIIPSGGSLKLPVIEKGKVKDILLLYADARKNIILSASVLGSTKKSSGVKKVLIVGGAGYLGSVLSRKLLRQGYTVRVLDNLTYGNHGITALFSHNHFRFIQGDCRNISDIIEAMKEVDAVIHLAAIVGDPACALNPQETIENNYLATMAIAQSAKFNQINKFLFASSCSVYGASKNSNDRLTENSPLRPVSLYAHTKIKSETALLSLADGNFAPTIFRFATLYGVSPRMRFDLVINTLTARAMKHRKIAIFGGRQYRPFIEVSDAARACIAWLKAPLDMVGEHIFNIGSNEQNMRIQDIGALIGRIIPDVEIEVRKEVDDSRDYNVSFEKAMAVLKFAPKKTIEMSIQEMKELLKKEIISDFTHPQYHNYQFLQL